MPTPTFISNCGDDRADMAEWNTSSGSLAASTTNPHDGAYSIQLGDGAVVAGFLTKSSVLAAAGRRISFWYYVAATPSAFCPILDVGAFTVNLSTTRAVAIRTGTTTLATSAGTVSIGWHRFCVSYTISSTTVYSIAVFVDGSSSASVTNGVSLTSATAVNVTFSNSNNASAYAYVDSVYIDDGTTLDDIGDVRVAAQYPSGLGGSNAFDTLIGSGANRYDRVNERPVSETNGIQQAGTTQVSESFAVSTRDPSLGNPSAGTVIGRTAWAWAKRGYNPGEVAVQYTPIATGGSATTAEVISPGFSAPIGAAVVVIVGYDDNLAITSVTDSVGNSYTALTAVTAGTSTSPRLQVFYSIATVAVTTATTFTVNHASSSVKGACGFYVVAGLGSPTTVDITKSLTGSGTAQTTNASATTAQANEIAIGAIIQNTGTAYAGTITGFTSSVVGGSSGGSGATNIQMITGYKQLTSTQTVTAATTGANAAWAAIVISFRASGNPTGSSGTPAIIHDGTATALTLVTSPALAVNTVSASALAGTSAVGLRSSGAEADSFLYECGLAVAYLAASTNNYSETGLALSTILAAVGRSDVAAFLDTGRLLSTVLAVTGRTDTAAFSDAGRNLSTVLVATGATDNQGFGYTETGLALSVILAALGRSDLAAFSDAGRTLSTILALTGRTDTAALTEARALATILAAAGRTDAAAFVETGKALAAILALSGGTDGFALAETGKALAAILAASAASDVAALTEARLLSTILAVAGRTDVAAFAEAPARLSTILAVTGASDGFALVEGGRILASLAAITAGSDLGAFVASGLPTAVLMASMAVSASAAMSEARALSTILAAFGASGAAAYGEAGKTLAAILALSGRSDVAAFVDAGRVLSIIRAALGETDVLEGTGNYDETGLAAAILRAIVAETDVAAMNEARAVATIRSIAGAAGAAAFLEPAAILASLAASVAGWSTAAFGEQNLPAAILKASTAVSDAAALSEAVQMARILAVFYGIGRHARVPVVGPGRRSSIVDAFRRSGVVDAFGRAIAIDGFDGGAAADPDHRSARKG